jgi:hypothetical protein
VVVDETLL